MGKRWTDEEKAILRKHYRSVKRVEDLAAVLGRPRHSVRKTANMMGLTRVDLHDESVCRILRALSGEPQSSREISEAVGIARSTANSALRRMSEQGLCYIVDLRRRSGRSGPGIPVWVRGEGENAKEFKLPAVRKVKQKAAAAEAPVPTPVVVRRDPFQEAFFGRVAA